MSLHTKQSSEALSKIAPNEPIFVLRAQDVTAPAIILEWLKLNPQIDQHKFMDAVRCAEEMRQWPKRRVAN